jgi:quercetin dioxygenase-like cupin family protein
MSPHTPRILEQLAPVALGLPEADPTGAVLTHLSEGCDICAIEFAQLRETAALLALGSDPLSSPADLRERINRRIQDTSFEFILATDGAWESAGNLEFKRLYAAPGGSTTLISLPTGSWLAEAYRPGHPGYVILRGELDGEGLRLSTGDFIPAAGKIPGRQMAVVMDTVLLAIAGPTDAEPLDSPKAVRSGRAAWNPVETGVLALPLAGSEREAIEISLVHMEAGAIAARHRHEWVEELCVVSGDCRCQGIELGPEDYHRAAPGTSHEEIRSLGGGTLVYIVRKSRA